MSEFDKGPQVPPHRVRRMLAALIGGVSPDVIGAEENLPTKAVERTISEELGRRWIAPAADFAKIQIARLENYCLTLMDRVEDGELAALDRAMKIVDRLDRYHGFRRLSPAPEPYTEDHRARLLAKLNAAEANLAEDDPEPRPGA